MRLAACDWGSCVWCYFPLLGVLVLLVVVVSALRHVPKPGYGLAPRSHTFSSTGGSVSNIGVSPCLCFVLVVNVGRLAFPCNLCSACPLMVKYMNRKERDYIDPAFIQIWLNQM